MNQLINQVKVGLIEHAPGILAGAGIVGFGSSVILAVTATPKAILLIESKKETEKKETLDAKETILTAWKCYIPAVVTFAVGAGCTIASLKVSERRGAAWAMAYSLSESAFREYQGKMVEKLGSKKEKEVRDEIAQEKIEKEPIKNIDVLQTGRGQVICRDLATERTFTVDVDDVIRAEEYAKEQLGKDGPGYIDWNDVYFQMHVGPTGMGEDLGWNRQNPLQKIIRSSCLGDGDLPMLAIDYMPRPYAEFWKYDDGTLL